MGEIPWRFKSSGRHQFLYATEEVAKLTSLCQDFWVPALVAQWQSNSMVRSRSEVQSLSRADYIIEIIIHHYAATKFNSIAM